MKKKIMTRSVNKLIQFSYLYHLLLLLYYIIVQERIYNQNLNKVGGDDRFISMKRSENGNHIMQIIQVDKN
ncbi:hypothetical protein Glove_241g14 [Diversispora epigaea]|uniref:Uncharacterized protein n=1 Tax=Diversispora epigaea TaxID=1348612 RepID=A0A397ICS3_9GLOM|nr:hypothetical protein Glove_241g14 [Diversispora epigaea]